ncbi:membrane protein [Bacillus coahuilensis p1.1.43]|uniref:Membrane protein n=1 Tax=Bacillus coahuilensis p1.1.43 TaxID=1150625 RepID=A0A147K7N8_9BACI|nr:hypothetical protein [Bacillus coahuilensis]KUP06169.1 membrane protein [Bacillus coahuilensis p1.1.43]
MNDLLRKSIKWSVSIAVITLVLAAIFSIISSLVLNKVSWTIGLLVVLMIVLIGIFFDMLGIAATAADETPFHAMASKKVYGARHSIRIVRNADRFASFCNDVIGDISGIISGTATAIVIIQLALNFEISSGSMTEYTISVILTSIIAAITVGGKAIGKTIAIHFSKDIIFQVGKVLQFVEENFHIVIIKDKKNKKRENIRRKIRHESE